MEPQTGTPPQITEPSTNRKRQLGYVGLVVFVTLALVAFLILRPNKNEKNSSVSEQTPPSASVILKEPFKFAAVGDFGGGENFRNTLKTIKQSKTNFTLALGDFSYGQTKSEKDWCNIVKSNLGKKHPFELIVGNHDAGNKPGQGHIDNYAKCLPNRIDNIEGIYARQYFFDYNNLARFIFISPDITIDGKSYNYKRGSVNSKWVRDTIDQARIAGLKWVVVTMHENCITVGIKKCEIGEYILNLLVTKKVDLVLQGHEHGYMRTKQLHLNKNCGSITPKGYKKSCVTDSEDDSFKKGAGTILAINGTGGIELRNIDLSRPEKPFFEYWSGKNIRPAYGPLIFTVSESSLKGQFISNKGPIMDTFSIN